MFLGPCRFAVCLLPGCCLLGCCLPFWMISFKGSQGSSSDGPDGPDGSDRPHDFFKFCFLMMFSRSLFCFHVLQMVPKVVKSSSKGTRKWSLVVPRDLIFSIFLEITKIENGSRVSRIQQGPGAQKCRCKPPKIYEKTNMEQRTQKTRQKVPPETPRSETRAKMIPKREPGEG